MENHKECNVCLPSGSLEVSSFDYINTPGARAARGAGLINLAELPAGERGVVETVSETDHDLAHLVRLGHNPAFVKGLEVGVLAKSPGNGPVLIEADGNIFDICNDVASVVWLKRYPVYS